jgi:hypothetical protein
MKFILGKSVVPGKPTDDIFAHLEEPTVDMAERVHHGCTEMGAKNPASETLPRVELAGPWRYFQEFRDAHGLCTIPVTKVPEIAVKAGATASVPIVVVHEGSETLDSTLTAKAPDGWKVKSGTGKATLPAEASTNLRVDIDTPALSPEELKKEKPQEVIVEVEAGGKKIGEVKLKVVLRGSGLPQ